MKIRPVGAELLNADGQRQTERQTDMIDLTVTFHTRATVRKAATLRTNDNKRKNCCYRNPVKPR